MPAQGEGGVTLVLHKDGCRLSMSTVSTGRSNLRKRIVYRRWKVELVRRRPNPDNICEQAGRQPR